jgi:membrane protein implicated in regulation of membrane protease activity
MVRVHGEFWSAFSDEPIQKGQRVIVEGMKGLTLKVKRA